MKRILLISPNPWDEEELGSERFAGRYEFIVLRHAGIRGPDRVQLSHLFRRFDPLAIIDQIVERYSNDGVVGVLGTDELLACASAAAIARHLGLPGPDPAAILGCQHKYHSRLKQREVSPEAVPEFALLDPFGQGPKSVSFDFPIFVKPVRATSSILAKRIENAEELRRACDFTFLESRVIRNLLFPFEQLLRRYTDLPDDAALFLAEGLLQGCLVTVEGYRCQGRFGFLGIVDSILHRDGISFERFDYPSVLPPAVQARMTVMAEELSAHLGLDNTLFNIEMYFRPEMGSIHLLEVNPRMCYQFADLYEKVEGFNSYEIALDVALGRHPRFERGLGRWKRASSFVLRRYDDARLQRLPGAGQIRGLKERFPDARVRTYGRPGMRLSLQKGVTSFRYGIINLGGESESDLRQRFDQARTHLRFRFSGAGRRAFEA